MTLTLAYIETESTGSFPDQYTWEIGLILENHPTESNNGEWLFQVSIRPDRLSPDDVNRYLLHGEPIGTIKPLVYPEGADVSAQGYKILRSLLANATLVGSLADRLAYQLRRTIFSEPWHHILYSIETLEAGFEAGRGRRANLPLWTDTETYGNSLDGARWAQAAYQVITAPEPTPPATKPVKRAPTATKVGDKVEDKATTE